MTQATVKLHIPFESLLEAISNLDLEEKCRLWKLLDEEINQIEEDSYDWETEGQPKGKPVEYIPGVGLAVISSDTAD